MGHAVGLCWEPRPIARTGTSVRGIPEPLRHPPRSPGTLSPTFGLLCATLPLQPH